MKPETAFRRNRVDPFLKTLKNSYFMSIQQVAIVGTPDKLGVCAGRAVAIEIKSRGGKLSELQKITLAKFERAGGVSLVANPDNWEEVKSKLIQLDQGKAIPNDQNPLRAGNEVRLPAGDAEVSNRIFGR